WSSFFFSSRRRHTSFSRDWSSDVCSSDLLAPGAAAAHDGAPQGAQRPALPRGRQEQRLREPGGVGRAQRRAPAARGGGPPAARGAEERRVGEEGRTRVARYT